MELIDYINNSKIDESNFSAYLDKPQYLQEILINLSEYLPQISIVDAFNLAIQIQRNQILASALEVCEESEFGVLRNLKDSVDKVSESLPPY